MIKAIFRMIWISCLICLFTSSAFAQTDEISPEFLLFGKEILVVTAARHEQEIGEAPATINVITAEDIKNSGCLTISDLLRSLPGLDVRNAGTKFYLAPRGLSNTITGATNRVLCLVDGRPINTPNHGSFFPDLTLPLVNIKRIEIIKGPGSAIYGANAFAGVINIITKSPEDIDGLEFSASGGEFSTQFHKLSFGKKSEKIGSLFTARWYKTDGSQLIADNTDLEDYNIYGKMQVSYFTLSFGHHETDRGLSGKTARPTPAYTEEIKESFVDCIGNMELNSEMELMVRGYINDRNDLVKMTTEATVNEKTIGADIQHNWQLGSGNLLICGVEIRQDQADSVEALNGEHSTTNAAIYLQDEFKPLDKLIVTLGVRHDKHSVYEEVTSPRMGAVYDFGRAVLKTSYGEAFRAPTFAELYTDMWHGPTMHMAGNKELKPEKIKAYEIGLGYKFTKDMEGEINTFYHKTTDLIVGRYVVIPPTGFPPIPVIEYDNENKDEAEIKGMEVGIKSKLFVDNLNGFVNYSYQEAKDGETDEDLDYAPKQKFNVGLNFKMGNSFTANTTFHYVGKRNYPLDSSTMPPTPEGELDAYTVTDAKLMASVLKNLELSLSVYNIFDEEYEETKFYPMPGTSWLAEVGYKF
ncbi:TonB-dependent receptor [bacterium]|nr:TonB-dependent receptor [bacterium]